MFFWIKVKAMGAKVRMRQNILFSCVFSQHIFWHCAYLPTSLIHFGVLQLFIDKGHGWSGWKLVSLMEGGRVISTFCFLLSGTGICFKKRETFCGVLLCPGTGFFSTRNDQILTYMFKTIFCYGNTMKGNRVCFFSKGEKVENNHQRSCPAVEKVFFFSRKCILYVREV